MHLMHKNYGQMGQMLNYWGDVNPRLTNPEFSNMGDWNMVIFLFIKWYPKLVHWGRLLFLA